MKNTLKKIFGGFTAFFVLLLIAVARKKNVKRFEDAMHQFSKYDSQ